MGWMEVVVGEDDRGGRDAVSPSSDRVEVMEDVPSLEEPSIGGVLEPNLDQEEVNRSKRDRVTQQNKGFELFVRGVAKVRSIS